MKVSASTRHAALIRVGNPAAEVAAGPRADLRHNSDYSFGTQVAIDAGLLSGMYDAGAFHHDRLRLHV
jgi:hypothetical protein